MSCSSRSRTNSTASFALIAGLMGGILPPYHYGKRWAGSMRLCAVVSGGNHAASQPRTCIVRKVSCTGSIADAARHVNRWSVAICGNRILLETQYVFEICRVPASLQPLAMGADAGGLLLEEVDSDVAQPGTVFSAMSFAHPAFIFTEADVEHPMKAVLDAPVRPNVPQHRRRIAG